MADGVFKAACVQLRSGQSVQENIAATRVLIAKAVAAGAEYVQTPEMTHLVERGRKCVMEKVAFQEDDAGVKAFAAMAKEHGIWLHIGSLAIARDDGKVANRAFLYSPDGTIAATYDKIHMFDVDLDHGESWRESSTYEPGVTSPVVKLPFARLGLAICYDVRFPDLFRKQALNGAEILTAPACFTRQTGEAHWHTLMKARAIENACFVVSAAQGGRHEDGRETFGHSLIVDPWGKVIAEADGDEPGFIIGELDMAKVSAARQRIPVLRHGRSFETSTVQ